jgi:hypothetical protein
MPTLVIDFRDLQNEGDKIKPRRPVEKLFAAGK